MQQILYIPKRERQSDVEHHRDTNDFAAGLEGLDWAASGHAERLRNRSDQLKSVPSTAPLLPFLRKDRTFSPWDQTPTGRSEIGQVQNATDIAECNTIVYPDLIVALLEWRSHKMQPNKIVSRMPASSGAAADTGMRFEDILRLTHDVRSRVESEWQRLINANAALIAVMVFFASRQEPFMAARIIVFAFYSVTVLTSVINLSQSYRGLRLLTHEMTHFPKPTVSDAVLNWLIRSDSRAESWLRVSLPILVWILVAYLMILPLIIGRTTLLH